MCATCTETDASECDAHGHDLTDADDTCLACGMPAADALAENAARAAAWERIGFELDRA